MAITGGISQRAPKRRFDSTQDAWWSGATGPIATDKGIAQIDIDPGVTNAKDAPPPAPVLFHVWYR